MIDLTHEQQQEIIAFTQELIRSPGYSGNEAQTAAIVLRKMESLGYDEIIADEYGNIIGILRGKQPGPSLMFDGHMDVVLVKDSEVWDHPPYGGELIDGVLWGRGASDMKGPLAAMICAPAFLKREDFVGTVIVSASVAEEYIPGCALGKVLDKVHADKIIVGEPSSLKLGIAEKGRAGVEIITRGTLAHSSRPDLGDNAVYRMLEVIHRIRSLPKRSHQFLGPEIIELVEIESRPRPGNGCIPDWCRSFWECRLLDDTTKDEFLLRWKKALYAIDKTQVRYAYLNVKCYTGTLLEAEDFLPGWFLPENHPFRLQVEIAIRRCGIEPELYAVPHGSNANLSSGYQKIPSLVLGPGDVALAHKPNEFIKIDELIKGAQIYASIVALNSMDLNHPQVTDA